MIIIGCLTLFWLGVVISFIFFWKKERTLIEKHNIELANKDRVLDVYFKYISNSIAGCKIEEYLLNKGFCRVAIYGLGRLGKNLFDEINQSNICLEYVIDREVSVNSGKYKNVKCYNPNSILPTVDVIIITVVNEYKEIAEIIRKKNEIRVISLEDIIDNKL